MILMPPLREHATGCVDITYTRDGPPVIEACSGLKGSPALGNRRCCDTF
ncbi:hypothetical protein FOPG_19758 [Fusarium oxysporum f. sp. conglutinans race 2 54008]|uniref:Uncharacterized protein n=1 Tax=Fusarium oxysporum f. sp. conglutinans race 2 54008 TaxID=1089457 RepID=X0GK14_FUSOX|nr:hypothetical protein FOPG_19758 [Fusarium oxysporum f. sp. conglutinans race 2 54008]